MIYSLSMSVSLYLHFPFCTKRCSYCDFNTCAELDNLISPYIQALCKEIKFLGETLPERYQKQIHTVYMGGGTPSLIPPNELQKILDFVGRYLGFEDDPEVTIEANPGTLTLSKLKAYVDMGINRISLGFQSANEHELRLLGRIHSLSEGLKAVDLARFAGIPNINLDLIYGLPNQTLVDWRNSLEVALSLDVEHLSLYCLTIEEGTVLECRIQRGDLPYPDSDFAATCYELARDMLAEASYLQYELSNWAKQKDPNSTYICLHNLQYWKNLEYLGIGAGAHGFIDHYRLVNVTHPSAYIQKFLSHTQTVFPFSPATEIAHPVSKNEEMKDTVLLGLRLTQEGIGEEDFLHRFDAAISDVFREEIERLNKKGLVEWIKTDQRRLRLTRSGQLLGNQAFIEFV